MKKEFVPYAEALQLREIGFNDPCIAWYNESGGLCCDHFIGFGSEGAMYIQEDMDTELESTAPLYQQAFRWFWSKHQIAAHVYPVVDGNWDYILISDTFDEEVEFDDGPWPSYEEAELACLRKLIEIVKTQTK
jgi:hypothetical protein